jgi:Putative zinc-finger
MDWNCISTEERLSDFLDGTLAPEEQAAFSAHRAGCASCAGMVARVGGLVSQMRQVAPVEEPPHLARKILTATRGLRTRERDARWWLAWTPLIWQPRFAMGLATVAATLAIVLHAAGVTPNDFGKIDYRPASLVREGNRQAHLRYARCVKFVNDLRVVYEIESQFASSPAPGSEPAPAPAAQPQPGRQPASPDSEPHDKSQIIPRRGRGEVPRSRVLAVLMTTSLSHSTPRSLL